MEITFDNIVGKTILVGLTYLSKDGDELERTQFWGTIKQAQEGGLITIHNANTNEEFTLPPDLHSFRITEPGEYRLRSTGESVVNPDLTTTWTIYKP